MGKIDKIFGHKRKNVERERKLNYRNNFIWNSPCGKYQIYHRWKKSQEKEKNYTKLISKQFTCEISYTLILEWVSNFWLKEQKRSTKLVRRTSQRANSRYVHIKYINLHIHMKIERLPINIHKHKLQNRTEVMSFSILNLALFVSSLFPDSWESQIQRLWLRTKWEYHQ